MAASKLAEKIGLTPKSPKKVMKWGIKPMLDTPQMKNANVTTQNRSDPDADRRASKLTAKTLPDGGGGSGSTLSSPNGGSPTSAGERWP
jgi:hypothetical protein